MNEKVLAHSPGGDSLPLPWQPPVPGHLCREKSHLTLMRPALLDVSLEWAAFSASGK